MSLNTAKKIVRRSWDLIPMPETVIPRVNVLDVHQHKHLNFTYIHGHIIGVVEIPVVVAESEK